MKLTTLLFGLLLAVGWTNAAQAQLRPEYDVAEALNEMAEGQEMGKLSMKGQSSPMMRAPLRAGSYTSTAPVTHVRSWYENPDLDYTWYDANNRPHTAKLTDVVDNSYQMYYLLKSTYMNPQIPGILHTDAWNEDNRYPGIAGGYDIYGTQYNDIRIKFDGPNAWVRRIDVVDAATETDITSWTGGALPNGWSSTPSLSSTTSGSYTWYYMNGGGFITIPHSVADGRDSVFIRVYQRAAAEGNTERIRMYNYSVTPSSTTDAGKYVNFHNLYGGIDRPNENGYTVFLVKLEDTDFSNVTPYTYNFNQLKTYFDTYIKSIELLTDGMRVEEGSDQAGTVFAYRGVLDKFFFIGKGKMYYVPNDRAPFYSMYEEFSPDEAGNGVNAKDLYANMRAGEYYYIRHDCMSVCYLNHYFSMAGKDTIAPKGVDPLIFYIPDKRGAEELERSYRENIRPQVGLYQIDLSAEAMQSVNYDQDSTYTVYLEWSSTLNNMTNSEVEQTYIIYTVTYDSIGTRIYTPLDTVYNETTYQYNVPQEQTSQTIHYVVMGFPTSATNNPVNQADGIFYTYSNLDDVQIPGWFDFMVLYRERYESDFIIHEEKNYYRNWLYPTNLAANTGMTMEQLKKEWPNQTASYTLWRDNYGVAVLEVRAIGKKVYYRIRYYDDTQVTTGPNNIEMPNGYQTITNN